MTLQSIQMFLRSTTARLAASYLAIIMILSLGFSFVLYNDSAHELGRQIPSPSIIAPGFEDPNGDFSYRHFFQRRIDEGRGHLLDRLIILNLFVLILGAALSYYLARRTLEPIEDAMDAQSRFVSDASHELRTPLTAILSSNEVALRKPHLTLAQAKKTLQSNVEEMVKLKALSDSLLNLSKQDSTQPLALQPVSMQDVASEAMNRVLTAAQAKKITVQDEVPAIKVKADSDSLAQVLAILLDNAIKYSPEAGTVQLSGHQQNGHGYLSVKDHGAGIAAKDLPHIFERFYRADSARNTSASGGGHGIGLSIAQKIIEQHHGLISVTSAPGHGSTFTVQLPLA